MELETGHPGIIYAYLLVVQDNVLIDSPVTAFQANKVKKTGGWFYGFCTTRPLFIRDTKKTPKARAGNTKEGVYATRGCVSTGTTRETRPRPRGQLFLIFSTSQLINSFPLFFSTDEEKFRNEFRKSESIYDFFEV